MTGAHMFPGDGFFWMGPGGMGLIWAIVTGVLWIGFWILIVWLIVRVVRTRPPSGGARPGLRVLEERYARGEIGRDEFLERRAVLRGEGSSAPSG